MKRIFSVFIALIVLFTTYSCVFAENNLPDVANNKYGIHIFSEKDLENAASLVNSNSGDWGYVTFVITESERDHDRWQQVFDRMRRLHLIPIVRIATKASGNTWDVPQESEINNWIAFLNSLNWVIQNRYVVISNEPNHADEWGGKVDPAGYAIYLKEFSQKLHSASSDFFVLPAGFDASSANTINTMDEARFLQRMMIAEPKVFDYIDGWTSHSYPNPDFSGKVTEKGRGTIDTFDWELGYLKSLGVTKYLPVFITETGWSNKYLNEDEIGRRLTYAYQNIWTDSRVIAVTPFILDYTQAPYDTFSWEKSDGTFYKFYNIIQGLPKISGQPIQVVSGQVVAAVAQPVVLAGSDFLVVILAKNTGQSIWNSQNTLIKFDNGDTPAKNYSFSNIEPSRVGLTVFKAGAPTNVTGLYSNSLFLTDIKGQRITNSFGIKAVITSFSSEQVGGFFGKIIMSVKTLLHIN